MIFPHRFQPFWKHRFLRKRFKKQNLYFSLCTPPPHTQTQFLDPFYPRESLFEQTIIYTTWGCFPASFSFGEGQKMSKVYRQTDGQTERMDVGQKSDRKD